ncbi:MAG: mechanosensitive ion channel, partial [Firmicutes bacterium]|nr:mechanosensitive ion channel [Bacillota bacterium]
IALGLASSANNVVSDLYGGISLIAESSIRVGRRIRAAGVEGRIIDMNIRKLRLIDDEGNIHIIPNKAVDGSTIVVIAENEESQS